MDGNTVLEKKSGGFLSAVKRFSKSYSILLAIATLFVIFSVASPYFLTYFNIRNIIQQTTAVSVVGIGASLIIMSGGLDLSLGQNLCMSSCIAAWLIKYGGWNPWLALLIAMLLGTAVGAVNGILRAYVGIPTFVATLGMQLICRGIAKIVTNASPIPGMPAAISWIGRGYIGGEDYGIPISVVIMIVLYVIFSLVLKYTKLGRNVYAIGGGPEAAYFAGIDVKKSQLIVHTIGGAFAAFGGIILLTRLDGAAITNGTGYEFDCTIACVMGGISLAGGRGKLVQSLLGAIFLALFFNGMTMLNVNSFVQDVLKGIVLLAAVILDVIRTKKRA